MPHRRQRLGAVSLLLVCTEGALLLGGTGARPRATTSSRRECVLGLFTVAGCLMAPGPASAFDNAVPEYANYVGKPKRPGTPPKDLGVASRTINDNSINADPMTFDGLAACDGKPHCFSTTGDELLEDRILVGVDNLIKPWKPAADDAAPFETLKAVVKAYEPGQGFVDGGGFKVVKETPSYLYVQFEALKKGYIDDVEFFLSKGLVQVRSSSRVGQTDFGVNAIRLNYIASALRKKKWEIDEITAKTHPDYFNAADDARDLTFDKDRRKLDGFEDKLNENGRLERPPIG